ncbi:MAG: heme transport system substrate-binding protein [Acidobacteriota bacterium]|jgi:iron complex transport system substrate-binding protein|nr:heme transport system substrate-binding protein [Acidobacteriota bacterium]
MKNRFAPLLLLAALLAATLSACQQTPTSNQTKGVTVTDASGNSVSVADSSRIVSVGTANTETIVALGAASRLVGVDNSSNDYIHEVQSLPKVGARTTLSAEGILSLKPTLVVITSDAGPPQIVEQLKGGGVTVLVLRADYNVEAVKGKLKTIARALGLEAKGEELAGTIDRDMEEVNRLLASASSKPKVLFVGRGPNMPNATMSGAGTTVDEMIRLAGGVNPLTGFEGFREMTDEAVVSAAPDVILMTEKSFERSGGVEGVLKFPGVALTPAGKSRRVVPVSDMYFQGFGPGVGRAVRELVLKLHTELGGAPSPSANATTNLNTNSKANTNANANVNANVSPTVGASSSPSSNGVER